MKKILAIIRSLAIWIIAVTFFIIWAFLLIVLSILLPIRIYDPVLKQGSKVFLRIIGIRRKVIGLGKFDPETRYIFMANHTNLLDAFVLYPSFKQIGRGLEKASHFSWPIYGWALKATKMVPIPSEG